LSILDYWMMSAFTLVYALNVGRVSVFSPLFLQMAAFVLFLITLDLKIWFLYRYTYDTVLVYVKGLVADWI